MSVKLEGSAFEWRWDWDCENFRSHEGIVANQVTISIDEAARFIVLEQFESQEGESVRKLCTASTADDVAVVYHDYMTNTILGIMLEVRDCGAYLFTPQEWQSVDWEAHSVER